MLPIIKIYHQGEKDVIKHIYVFLNNHWIENNILSLEESLNELQRTVERKETGPVTFIFTETELRKIYRDDIPITFFAEPLHMDDTIMTIKGKIIEHTKLPISLPEIYLYGVQREKISLQTLYEKLTQDGEIILTRERLLQFLQNFVRFNIADFKSKEGGEFHEDLLPYTEFPELIKFPIGQKFIMKKNFPYMVSPFGILQIPAW